MAYGEGIGYSPRSFFFVLNGFEELKRLGPTKLAMIG